MQVYSTDAHKHVHKASRCGGGEETAPDYHTDYVIAKIYRDIESQTNTTYAALKAISQDVMGGNPVCLYIKVSTFAKQPQIPL